MTATCDYCKRDMSPDRGCDPLALSVPVGDDEPPQLLGRAPWGTFVTLDVPDTCHDCATPKGGYHHSHCVLDLCPHMAQVGVGDCPEGCKVVA